MVIVVYHSELVSESLFSMVKMLSEGLLWRNKFSIISIDGGWTAW